MSTLNPQQLEAATTLEGPVVMIAGAGSGKTKTVIDRIDNLVAAGVAPQNILAITFTNKAANELKERLSVRSALVHASTIHSLCVSLLKRYAKGKIGENLKFTVMDSDDQKNIISQVFEDLCEDLEAKGLPLFAPDERANKAPYIRILMNNISDAKNENIWAEDYPDSPLYKKHKMASITAPVYTAYQRTCQRLSAFDFDDLLMYTYRLLNTNKSVLNAVQNQYQYITVDEYQDTNVLQNDLVNLMASKYRNLCVVGDPDQSIYGWRGAHIDNILNFEKVYPDAKVVYLNRNYRSAQNILDIANDVIQNNDNAGFARKELQSGLDVAEQANKYTFENASDEAEWVAKDIAKHAEKGRKYKDVVILYRTHALNREFEHALQSAGVPYKIHGGLSFYDRAEIKDVIAYLNVLANFSYDPSLRRIINVPSRNIGAKTLQALGEWSQSQPIPQPLLSALLNVDNIDGIPAKRKTTLNAFTAVYKDALKNNRTIVDLIGYFVVSFDYKNYLMTLDNSEDRINNVDELLSDATRYDEANPPKTDDELKLLLSNPNATAEEINGARAKDALLRLTDFLATLATERDANAQAQESLMDGVENDYVTLMTVHASKGLEWESVYIVGGEDGIFPSAQSIKVAGQNPRVLNEERRLMYVAITRAKHYLTLTNVHSRLLYGNIQHQPESRFYSEIKHERLNIMDFPDFHPERRKKANIKFKNPWG